MSRSYKKTPVDGMTKRSGRPSAQKKFRTQENKAKRRAVRISLAVGKEMPAEKEYGNEWASPRDGKIRFDPKEDPKNMRK